MKREEYIKLLRNNESFQMILQQSKDEDECRRIKAYAEDFMGKFYDNVYQHFDKAARENPQELLKSLAEIFNAKGDEK